MEKIKYFLNRAGVLAEGVYFISGVLMLKWSPMLMATGYWIKEAVMFVVTACALIYIRMKKDRKIFLGRYFFFYGFFLFGHTVLFLALAAITSGTDKVSSDIIDAFFALLRGNSMYFEPDTASSLAITFFVILFTVIYTVVSRISYSAGDTSVLINQAFGAIIAPHFLIILGAGAILLTGAPYALAAVLAAIKLLVDMTGFALKGSVIVSVDEVN